MFDLTPSIVLSNGQPVTSSLKVAEHFEKQHDDVLRTIRDIIRNMPDSFRDRNFAPTSYTVEGQNRSYPAFHLTRDGFTLVAMGFTGRKALAWKIRYIQAFNAMEAELKRLAQGAVQPPPSPDAVRGVRPALRAKAMHAAVQAVRLTGGGEEDIQRLFVTYCGWLSAGPLPEAAETETELGRAVRSWAGEWLVPSRDRSTRSWDLYDHFRAWLRRKGWDRPMPSVRAFGEEMSRRFRRCKSSSIRYHVLLREGA
jgi:Rha family phage regulatory protein